MIFFQSFLVTISFFSTLPVPILNWTNERIRYIPANMSIVGGILGSIIYLVFRFISFEPFIMSIVFIVLYSILTGGLHNDALMDTADAHFSRRSIPRKLEIMTDSRVGAFAVMCYVNYLLLFFVTMYLFFTYDVPLLVVIFVLMISRLMVAFMNYNLKYAKEDGLAKMYGVTLVKKDKWILYLTFLLIGVGLTFISPFMILVEAVALTFYHIYKRFMYKQFYGMTGDLLGTYVLLSELVMLVISIAIHVWL